MKLSTHKPVPSRRAIGLAAAALIALAQVSHAANYTLPIQQAAGLDWNSTSWQPGALGATTIIGTDPVATFEMLPGSRLRSPNGAVDAFFPGPVLTVDGDSVLAPTGSGATSSEVRFKQGANTAASFGTNTFTRLVLNGGQLDSGNDGTVVLNGQVDVAKDSFIINDGTNDRGFQINAKLTGSAKLTISEYAPATPDNFRPTYTHNIQVTGTNNTFTGQWNVLRGILYGSGLNALGTNNITVGSAAAFTTAYDVNSPKATLQLNGRMYLTQDDKFGSVTVGTTALSKGVHTFDELTATFPNNFPATWTQMINGQTDVDGNPITFGAGSIEVLNDNTTPVAVVTPLPSTVSVQAGAPANFSIGVSGPVISATWYSNNVVVATGTILNYTTPPLALSADGAVYKVVVANTVNSVTNTSTVAIVTTPLNFTMSVQEAIPESWDTAGKWSDGNPASVSAAANPLNTYEVLVNARLRTPDSAATATFPGSVLTVDGDGIWNVNLSPDVGELRFKQSGGASGEGSVYFPKLVLNGGQLDVGNDGTAVIQGQLVIAKNSSFSVNNVGARGYRVEALLSGTNTIEFHGSSTAAFNPAENHDLNIAGTNNPFSGKWNIVTGTLLGSAPGSLGTGDIVIGVNGAFLTTYNITNTTGSLFLNGLMYLTQDDTFRNVTVNGQPLVHGTYTYDQLAAMFPNSFPGAWNAMVGAPDAVSPAGSITVLEDNSIPVAFTTPIGNVRVLAGQPITLSVGVSGPYATVQWFANDVLIPDATGLTYITPALTAGDNNTTYKVVVSNNVNSVNSSSTITIGNPFVSQGFMKDEVWFNSALTLGSLQDPDFLATTPPDVTRFRKTADGVTAQGDTYVERLTGYFTPSVTGDYVFFLATDDNGSLYLSTDTNAVNKVQIAAENNWSNEHEWTISGGTSLLSDKRSDQYNAAAGGFTFNGAVTNQIHLTAGTSYYLEADHREGTGGDDLGVTFKLVGETDPVNGSASRLTGSLISVVTVDGTSLVLTNPVSVTVQAGTNATFTVGVNSSTTNVVYQWQRNETNIIGANAATYTTGTLTAADDQARFRVIVSAVGAPVQTSGTATLTVQASGPAQPNIKNAAFSGGNFTFAFTSQLGVSYRVQFKNALSDANWQDAETKVGTGSDIAVSYPMTGTTRFYQVVTP